LDKQPRSLTSRRTSNNHLRRQLRAPPKKRQHAARSRYFSPPIAHRSARRSNSIRYSFESKSRAPTSRNAIGPASRPRRNPSLSPRHPPPMAPRVPIISQPEPVQHPPLPVAHACPACPEPRRELRTGPHPAPSGMRREALEAAHTRKPDWGSQRQSRASSTTSEPGGPSLPEP